VVSAMLFATAPRHRRLLDHPRSRPGGRG
jgi:hypothetical protein